MATVQGAGLGDRYDQVVSLLQMFTPELWAATAVFFVVGDLLTTAVGLVHGGAAEAGPVVAPLLEAYGLVAMLPLKVLAVLVCVALWRLSLRPHAVGVPLGLAAFGVLVTGWNLGVLLVTLVLV